MRNAPVGWIVTNWRLKVLALILAVGLLGAVAFSENPPTFDTVPVRIQYVNPSPSLVVMNPPQQLSVGVAGLRGDVQRYRASAAGVTIDLAKAKAGANQVFFATPKVDVDGVSPAQSTIAVRLTLEPLVTRQLDIEVRTPKKSPGLAIVPDRTFATCGNSNDRCQVTVSAAESVVSNLKAYVAYDVSITTGNFQTSPNQPIQFQENGHDVNLGKDVKTLPAPDWTPEVVTVQVATQGGSVTRTLGVTYRLLGTQACGYVLTSVDVLPNTYVNVTGPIDAVARMTSVSLDSPIVIAGLAMTTPYTRSVVTGSAQITADPSTVRVVVNVAPQFQCAAPTAATGAVLPVPSVTPSPRPAPSPT